MKKNIFFRRLTSGLLVVSMLTGLTACGGGKQTEQAGDTGDSGVGGKVSQPVTFPLEKPVEITIAAPDSSVASLADNLPIWKEIERRTNVKIKWDVTASAQYVEVMKLRVTAGGRNLPDIMMLPNGLSLAELGKQGIILPLEEYIDSGAKNIQKAYEQFPNARALTSADGHVYSINTMMESVYFSPYTFIIRKDWLDRLGLKAPTTIDEWVTVMEAFRDQDANGDGDPGNEIPFTVGGHAWYTTYWANGWGLHLFQSDGWYPDENGKMQYEFISDEAKEFYIWLNNFYEQGLLDPEFLTMGDETKMFEKVARNNVGAFTAYASNIPMMEEALKANGVKDAELIPLVPPKGPYAQQVEVLGDMSANGYVVTSGCKNPDVAVALLDYLLSDEGGELMNFGIEGETYTKAEDGTYSYTELITANPDGLSAKEALESYGCQIGGPFIKSEEREEAMLFSYPEKFRELVIQVSDETRPYATPGLTLPPATAEESDTIAGLQGDLATYIWEMTGKFTVGTADVEKEWDSFVSYVKELGADQILAVKQAQYDRLIAEN